MRIGVDLMGSESSPQQLLGAVFEILPQLSPADSLVIFATEDLLSKSAAFSFTNLNQRKQVDLHLVSEVITMDDDPLASIRLKKGSSLVIGITQLKEKKIDAFVTAGNTGAVIACSSILLPLMKGIERPALLASLPTLSRPLALVDVGGLVSFKPQYLVQNAHFGAAFQRCSFGINRPSVGLLNIGTESKKGTPEMREAYRLLQAASEASNAKIRFLGNIEGREVFQGKVDVLVTDGFTGNVLLKTTEGISSFIFDYLKQELAQGSSTNIERVLDGLKRHFSYEEYPGALVCGIEGILLKCHGATTSRGVAQSISGAIHLVKNDLLNKIQEELVT